ncbi:MAG TPA: hypothetical protein VFX59_00005, partial [Polyangiales bacterium]|nr:hypothetical protein [Polyangiales bacterium]
MMVTAAAVQSEETTAPRVVYAFETHGDTEAHWAVVHVQIDGPFSTPYKLELELASEQGDD